MTLTSFMSGPSEEELKRMYRRSRDIRVLTVFSALFAALFLAVGVFKMGPQDSGMSPGQVRAAMIFGGALLASFYVAVTLGLHRRTSWGRIVGIIACLPFALGLIGLYALWVLFTASELFGADRITHEELVKALEDKST